MNQRNPAWTRSVSFIRGVLPWFLISGFFIQACEDPAVTNPADPNYELTAPTLLTAEAVTDTSITLTWKNNEEYAEEFVIYQRIGSGSYRVIGTVSSEILTFIDSICDLGIEYSYVVQSRMGSKLSMNSNSKSESTSLSAPTNLSGVSVSETSIQLTWFDNCDFENGYYVERKIEEGPFTTIQTLVANSTSYQDEDVIAEITYQYRIAVFTNHNISDYSNTVVEQISLLENLLNGIWKVTSTTNAFDSYNLSMNETLTFSNTTFDGSEVSGNITMVSLQHGSVSGPFTYNPTGQTLIITYSTSPYVESFNGVAIDGTTLSFSNSSYDFTLTEQEEVNVFEPSLWNGTWRITSTTNAFDSYNLSMNETLTFSNTTFDGSEVSGNITMVSLQHGSVSGPFTYNPTGQTLIITYSTSPYVESFNGVAIDGTTLSFSNSSYDFTLTKQ